MRKRAPNFDRGSGVEPKQKAEGTFCMLKKDETEIEGVITENLPNTTFRVETLNGRQILCTMSGRMRIHHIRVLPGDRVRLVTTPYDKEKGRITYKLK